MNDTELKRLARRAARDANKAKEYKAKADLAKADIVAEMEERGLKGLTAADGLQVTYVAPETIVYNERKLRRILGPTLWRRCHKLVFDPDVLGEFVQEGTLDAAKLERCTEVEKRKPYVLITESKHDG